MAGLRFDYEDAVRFLVARGVEEDVLRLSSIPERHLRFIRATILEQLRPRRHPLISLHIGNFVGISLAAYVDALRTVSRLTTVIAIDPNIVAAGIKNPQEHVIELLARYDLLSSVLLLTGYSFERTEFAPNDLTEELSPSGTDALTQLGRLPVRFDSALVDGNHRGTTVERELAWLRQRLRRRSVVFLDDATDEWPEIRDVFAGARGYARVGHDGRIGALRPT
jgi:hypothetical protein